MIRVYVRIMRTLLGLLLSLCLAATSLTMAVARGQARVGMVVVLCTGTGPLAVAVDAGGKPLKARHICPDCALSLFVAIAEAPPDLNPPGAFHVLAAVPLAGAVLPQRPALWAFARGPPAAV